MAFYSLSSLAFAIILSTIFLSKLSSIEAKNGGFSVDLIHRDSQKSPFYNPSLTPWERMNNALRRSNDRVNRFMSILLSPGTATTEMIAANAEYFIRMAIGTLPVKFLGVADTGSDLLWIQCQPCENCYKQKGPLFNPRNSSTYKDVLCSSKICRSIEGTSLRSCFPGSKKKCRYSLKYLDKSFTRGVVATETITLSTTKGKPVRLPKIVFGCGHNNNGLFSAIGSGLVGLGGGRASLISQMRSLISGKFSYCLVPHLSSTSSSKMHFGSKAVVSGTGVVSTPLVVRSNFYYAALKGISVGTKRLELSRNASGSSKGNIIIDSGTTATYIPPQLYFPLEWEIRRAMTSLKPVKDPQIFLRLCYIAKSSIDAPVVTLHFSGADVKLNPTNIFIRSAEDVQCLAFVPNNDIAVLGNLAQMNVFIGYDLKNKTLSFKPTDCTKQ